ncbi:phage tail protein [Nocardioides sp.]|uniref:phage tail protein n=1 Tax=Nocardioides sp. TaxID=35761 RepID=UPI002C4ACD27|nr:phage tail protein [Nocardioides sp.]HXH78127.1 phage tail protein [Nocardioides sp.]
MDVQGSQFHLLHDRPDWARCVDDVSGHTLAAHWAGTPGVGSSAWEHDDDRLVLRLRRETPLFRRAGGSESLDVERRRGAGRDGYGNWFWIDETRTCICWLPAGQRWAATWWSVSDLDAACTCSDSPVTSGFTSVCICPPSQLQLSGLAVTTHHYLLVGYTSPIDAGAAEAGLLVFDLQAGGAPLRMLWPPGFQPWDLSDTPDGGALVLDREAGCYWRLDEHLRLRGQQPSHPIGFTPTDGSDPVVISGTVIPAPLVLLDKDGDPVHPISIEPGPGGSVLVIDSMASRDHSVLFCYDGVTLRWQRPLKDVVQVVDPDDPEAQSTLFSVVAHDFAYDLMHAGAGGPLDPPMLYVADVAGDQVIAFALDPDTGEVIARDEFLPLRRWAERALVRTPDGVHYDFGERWISLQVFSECRFVASGTLLTPITFGDEPGLPGDSFDSGTPACVWHRLLLDMHVPTGTSVTVRARAGDDPTLLRLETWLIQPVPYLRSGGSELPWTDPWADRRGDVRDPAPLPEGMGTHELLFQNVVGRYVQLELTFTGSGRATPWLRSLRVWYPRFSYPEHYLPAVFAEHDGPDRFLERFLANPEGVLTALEEKIEHSHLLLDSRTAPGPDLTWLSAWFGLALDPLWDESRRRFLIRHIDRFYRIRGTALGVVATLRVYLEPVVDEGVFRSAAFGTGGIRVVERFLTRDTGGVSYGAAADAPVPDLRARVRAAAHRFEVLVPQGLSDQDVAMVQRIVELARPAHAAFSLRHYYELFVIGQARLGLDTEIGHAPSYVPVKTGSTPLAAGHLAHPHPFDLTDRIVSDRDRVARGSGAPVL